MGEENDVMVLAPNKNENPMDKYKPMWAKKVVEKPEPAQEVSDAVVTSPSPAQDDYKSGAFYNMFLANKKKPKEYTDEDKKKMRRQALFASIGDGLNAFHQAYANARGVKPMTDNVSLSGKALERYNKMQKEHEAEKDAWNAGAMKAMQMDETLRQNALKNAIETRRQDRLDKETKIKEQKADAYQQYQKSLTDKNNEQAAYWKAKWEALEAGYPADIALKKARAAQAEAAANLSNVRAANGGFAPTRNANDYTTETVEGYDNEGNKFKRVTKTNSQQAQNGSNVKAASQTKTGRFLPNNNKNNQTGSLLPKK